MFASTKNNVITSANPIQTRSEAGGCDPFKAALERLRVDIAITHPKTQVCPISFVQRKNSNMLRVQLQQDEGNQHLLVKEYKIQARFTRQDMIDRLEKDYAIMKKLNPYWQDSSKFAVPRPIACYPDLLILVMEECPGENLSVVLKREASFFPPKRRIERPAYLCHLCGEWLKAHQNSSLAVEKNELYSLQAHLDYIDSRLQRLVRCPNIPLDELFRQDILECTEQQWADVHPSETAMVDVHGDYSPGNVMVDGKKLIIIDLERYGRGPVYLDLSRFYHQLDLYLLKPTYRPGVVSHLQRALLDGYNVKLSAKNPFFELMLVRHTLCHLVGLGDFGGIPIHERWYNRRVIRRHIYWLKRWVRAV